jgi:beta-lactamase superfamily II metal-dependent hydrolase
MLLCPRKPFGHPSPEVMERLINRLGEDNVYNTDEDGTIEFTTDGERLSATVEKY